MEHVGGTEVATSMLARGLKSAGWNVAIAGMRGPLSPSLEAEGVESIPCDLYSHNPLKLAGAVLTLRNSIRRLQPQIIHCQMARPVPLLWSAIKMSGLGKNIKLFWTSRGLEARTYPRIVPLFNWLGVRALGNCAGEEEKLLRYGMEPLRCSYVYNPYRLKPEDRRLQTPPALPLVIGTLAALRTDRRIDHFLAMAAALVDRLDPSQEIEFRIAGDGPARATLEAQAEHLGIASKVRFLGNITDVTSFLSSLHVEVSTAFSELPDWGAGLSNAIVEAMLIGVPVVAYDAAGINEIVRDGETGRLILPGDVTALTNAVADLASDPAQAEKLAEAAHQNIIEACDPNSVLARLLHLYKEL